METEVKKLKERIIELEVLEVKHKQSEETLRHALREAYDELENKYGNILDCNKAYMKLLGFYREEILGNHIETFYINESKSMFKERFKKIKKDETIRKMCYEVFQTPLCDTSNCPLIRIFRGKDRIENVIEIQSKKNLKKISCILTAIPFKGPNGELIGIIEDFKDININNLIQNKLQKKISIDQQLIEISTDGSYVTDVEGNIMDANPAFCNLIGYSKEELLCIKIKDIEVLKTSHEKPRNRMEREIAKFETQYRHKKRK